MRANPLLSRLVLAAALTAPPAVHAIPGDLLLVLPLPSAGNGVSVAADCSGTIFYTVRGTRELFTMDITGMLRDRFPTVDATNTPHQIDEIAWDGGRGILWGAEATSPFVTVWHVDPANGRLSNSFISATSGGGIVDGIAYDGLDDTIWLSRDVSTTVEHYDALGTHLGTLTPQNASGTPLGSISGVQVGVGDLLYLGQNGRQQIVRVRKSDGFYLGSFASPAGTRDEGLECDPISFAPLLALWSREYNTPSTLVAIEVEPGSCTCGGPVQCNDDLALSVPQAPAAACVGSTVTLDGSRSQACGSRGLSYEWSDGSTIVCPASLVPTCEVTVSARTTYTLTVVCRDNPACRDTATVTVDVTDGPIAALAPLPAVCPGDRIDLDATASLPNGCPGALEFQFEDPTGILRAWDAAPTFGPVFPAATTTYTAEVRCAAAPGCVVSDAETVTIDPGTRPPDAANTLRHVKRARINVEETWGTLAEAKTYVMYRSTAKGTWPPAPLRTALPAPTNTEADVLPPPALYFYRVAGVSCGGLEGP